MTISVLEASSGPYFPNGATVAFPFYFKAMAKEEIAFVAQASDGTIAIFAPSLYTVTLAADGEGGTVTFTAPVAASPLPHFVVSEPSFEQQILFEDEGPFNSAILNPGLDRAAIRDLFLRDRLQRGMRVAIGEEGFDIPLAAFRAGRMPVFDLAGRMKVLLDANSVVTTDALGRVSGTPVIDVLRAIGTEIIDDGVWGSGFDGTNDGVWG